MKEHKDRRIASIVCSCVVGLGGVITSGMAARNGVEANVVYAMLGTVFAVCTAISLTAKISDE